jgi:hypothetical protein
MSRGASLPLDLWIPREVEVFCSQDWGWNAPGVLLWWYCLTDGHYHIAREYKFQQQTAEEIALRWKAVNKELGGPKVRYVAADPSMWAKTGAGRGESIAETLQRLGLPMRKGDNDRKLGWARCHELLRLAPDGRPWLTVDESCRYGLRSLPAQMSDPKDPDDLDTTGDDHWVDALRYGAMSRPSPTRLLAKAAKLHPLLEEALAASRSHGTVLGSDNVRRVGV